MRLADKRLNDIENLSYYCEVPVEAGRCRFCVLTTKKAQAAEIGWS